MATRKMKFMGLDLTGENIGTRDERWESDRKRFFRDLPLMIVLGVDTIGEWFVIVTCRSRCIQLSVQGKPSKRAALTELKKRVLLAKADLAAFKVRA